MNREMSVGELLSELKREIADRQRLVDELEARVGGEPARKTGMAAAAIAILKDAGRPMHGLHEILPALQAKGFVVGSRAGFSTALLRTGSVERVAPGTFRYKTNLDVKKTEQGGTATPANDAARS